MSIETRPALDGIPDEQRVLALAHWWLWRLRADGHLSTDLWAQFEDVMGQIEGQLQPITLHRLAQAKNRYWREVRA